MKNYNVKVDEINTYEFTVNETNKKNAREVVEDIIFNSCILKLRRIKRVKTYKITITRNRHNEEKKSSVQN